MGKRRSRSRSPRRERHRSRSREREPRGERVDRDRDRRRDRGHRSRSRSPPRRRRSRSYSPRRRSRENDWEPTKKEKKGGKQMLVSRPQITDADLEGKSPDEIEMMKTMGFGGFESTKGKQVPGNDIYVANIAKKRRYRQYMNRRGGFNRPLDFIA